MKRIFLYGPPASGKTTLGRLLAAHLGAAFCDLDEAIEDAAECQISKIFRVHGEAHFRDLESETLKKVIAANETHVISLGGGTLLREANRALAEANGTVLCLEAPQAEELTRRMARAKGTRPLGDKAEERAAHYASFPNRIADSMEAGPSLIVIGAGIARAIVGETPVVIDENVARLQKATGQIYTVPSGEEHKTLETVTQIWHAFATAGLGRKDCVAAVGGGVTCDLTGFAAATWMRGMDWISVPTTLLAMVDASTGGKTGCDLPEGKNLAGAFHAPRLVIIDSEFLATLPPKIMAAGRAEMIKHDIIAGRFYKSVAENLRVKVKIVEEDPFETTGRRLLLNCGHTVAHAVEKLTNYTVPHGEAVAIGCVAEARFAVRLGLARKGWPEQVAAVFRKEGLPTELPDGIDFERMRPVMRGDKKRAGDAVTFALPCGFGDVRAVPIKL